MTEEYKKGYLDGELNAVQACGQAITEAVAAVKRAGGLDSKQAVFVHLEFMGIIYRASALIEKKNKDLAIVALDTKP